LFALPLAAVIPALNAPEREYRFHHDHVLGTSLDLILFSPTAQASESAEVAVLEEIDRLCGILSTYHPASEISRLNASRRVVAGSGAVAASDELREVIAVYRHWNRRTSGAISAELGSLMDFWKKAEAAQKMPSPSALAAALSEGQTLNVDALGKAYVMEKAAAAALRAAPEISGLLLNLGGDILVLRNARAMDRAPRLAACAPSGSQRVGRWSLGVADPANGRDNSPALTHLSFIDTPLTKTAIATSGVYERGYRFGERSYSHILDPRTGYPSQDAAAATVIAPDSVTANALATALCILPAHEGLDLVEKTPAADCLVERQ